MSYGFDGPEKSTREIAQDEGVSREMVRRVRKEGRAEPQEDPRGGPYQHRGGPLDDFGRNHGQVEEEELYKLASRCGSLRQMADELGIPHGTFWRYLGKEENREIRSQSRRLSRPGKTSERGTKTAGGSRAIITSSRSGPSPTSVPDSQERLVGDRLELLPGWWGPDQGGGRQGVRYPPPLPGESPCPLRPLQGLDALPARGGKKTEDMEGLAERTLERKEHDYYLHLQEKEIHHLRREVQRYRERESTDTGRP